ncbi:MAG TPA: hypothetical protein VEJ20_09580 [Candidatus Eremiobacteraceae bacterium]|nr:hypothetical protein [Candidatus Eremiobacteraceae bacterium]
MLLLALAMLAVGVLHTAVPDHWAPLAVIARQHGWTAARTARMAVFAGFGHTFTTVLIGSLFWLAGVTAAQRFGRGVDDATSIALVGFGAWMAVTSWRELRAGEQPHDHDEPITRLDRPSARQTLLLILGSSPSVEALPVFFGAARYGLWFVAVVAGLFAISTIATYVAFSLAARSGLAVLRLGKLERYGEVLSGAVVALLGAAYFLLSLRGTS